MIIKELFDNFDYLRGKHSAYFDLTKEGMRENLSAPLHPGDLKYYREAGLMP
jgi:TRAP-type uncharacterized transport system substrate-binding protein